MNDPSYETARAGCLVLWEDIARDGAQAKTLLTGQQRVSLARAHGEVFGTHGPHHLIFAAGFPAIGKEEFEAIRQVAGQVDNCGIASHGRATRGDVDLNLAAVQGARHGRICLFVPASERMARALLRQSARQAADTLVDVVRYAVDRSNGTHVDVSFADAFRGDQGLIVDTLAALAEEGVRLVKLCDTVGEAFPAQIHSFFQAVLARAPRDILVGAHLHNDLGLGLMNNLEAIRAGARVVGSSWLGLAERSGLAATEQLLFVLAHCSRQLDEQFGFEARFWLTPPDLKRIVPLAREVSQYTGVPLSVKDPIVGTGVNSISTGTPFVDPSVFQPYDPEEVLGVPRRVLLTQLASRRVVVTVAERLGFELDDEQVIRALSWVKSRAFESGCAVVADDEFLRFLVESTSRPARAVHEFG